VSLVVWENSPKNKSELEVIGEVGQGSVVNSLCLIQTKYVLGPMVIVEFARNSCGSTQHH